MTFCPYFVTDTLAIAKTCLPERHDSTVRRTLGRDQRWVHVLLLERIAAYVTESRAVPDSTQALGSATHNQGTNST